MIHSITTLSIRMLSITTLSLITSSKTINKMQRSPLLYHSIQNLVMLGVIYFGWHNKPFMLSAVMLCVVMLNVVVPGAYPRKALRISLAFPRVEGLA